MTEPRMDPYWTHIPVLAGVLAHVPGPVLEVGTGFYSGNFLPIVCAHRPWACAETSPDWLAASKAPQKIPLDGVAGLPATAVRHQQWGVTLIDCAPASLRKVVLRQVAYCSRVVVLHDADPDIDEAYYGCSEVYPLYTHRLLVDRLRPATMILSVSIDVKQLFNGVF